MHATACACAERDRRERRRGISTAMIPMTTSSSTSVKPIDFAARLPNGSISAWPGRRCGVTLQRLIRVSNFATPTRIDMPMSLRRRIASNPPISAISADGRWLGHLTEAGIVEERRTTFRGLQSYR